MATEMLTAPDSGVGPLLRDWRRRRHRSQLDLALEAGVSARHISFVETGRSRPSRGMVLGLAENLEVPLRDRNQMLLAAGFAPEYRELIYEDPALAPVRAAVEEVLTAHDPYPALVVDRHWELIAANAGLGRLLEGVAPELLEPPVNALRASLHPDGLAPRILNLGEWRHHVLARLERVHRNTGDAAIATLLAELRDYPGGGEGATRAPAHDVFVPLRLRTIGGEEIAFFGLISTFGTAVDLTVAELALESFFPLDDATRAWASR
jgi:transcriptional regulator with XRE-family HTH domain